MKHLLDKILLVDLPTYPKGVLSLSLINVASCLEAFFSVTLLDLNLIKKEDRYTEIVSHDFSIIGFKVSSQNVIFAQKLSLRIKEKYPDRLILWGGEFPSLLPDEAIKYCDVVIKGQFEEVTQAFANDYKNKELKEIYDGSKITQPFQVVNNYSFAKFEDYNQVMGVPLETSKGCTEKCSFCMVHVMQKKFYHLKPYDKLEQEIKQLEGHFINIIDYNFGVSEEHVVKVCGLLSKHNISGWMAEMCIELLENQVVLEALEASNCRMIYCGLETLEQEALESVHKMNTNHVDNYNRIIKKAQSHGVQIASGIILGIKGSGKKSFKKLFDFHQNIGTIYTKLTFLTYNPGTAVKKNMAKKGDFPYEEFQYYDGNHLSYIPHGVEKEEVINGSIWFINSFYNFFAIIQRAITVNLSLNLKIQFILFSYSYGTFYKEWVQKNALLDDVQMNLLLEKRYHKSFKNILIEKLISYLR